VLRDDLNAEVGLTARDLGDTRPHAGIGYTVLAWSPDGQQLLYSAEIAPGGAIDLFVINADGTGLRQLTRDKYAQLMPAWSPDGRTIAYVTDEADGGR